MRAALRAQALVWMALLLPMFVALAGLSIDGALLLMTRRQLQSVVDGAARAGATQLDQQRLRGSGGSTVQLDVTAARTATHEYLGQHLNRDLPWAVAPHPEVRVTERQVHVDVRGDVRTAFLRVVQVERVSVGATALADVQFGIRGPDGR
jgi:Flp pilus assembly protein TadG